MRFLAIYFTYVLLAWKMVMIALIGWYYSFENISLSILKNIQYDFNAFISFWALD